MLTRTVYFTRWGPSTLHSRPTCLEAWAGRGDVVHAEQRDPLEAAHCHTSQEEMLKTVGAGTEKQANTTSATSYCCKP